MINAYAAMKAHGKLEPWQYDPGALARDQVEIDVDYCGICHSDISMLNNEWGMSSYPLVAGHEVVGRIAAVGADVTHLKIGQVVGLGWHSDYCKVCSTCGSGDHNLCASAQGTIVAHHGGFADKVRANASAVIPLPEGMDAKTAGPLFCGGITVFNPMVQFDVKPTDKVAVIGIGGLGHLGLQFLRAWGCEVTAFTSSDSKAAEAKELGAHHCINSRSAADIEQAAGKFDFIISTVNVKLDWNLYLGTLKPKGRLHFVGATLEPLDLNVFSLIMAQRSVSGSPVGSPATIAKMLDFAVQHDIKPVVETFKFSQINEALAHLESGKARYRIVLER
ncbi:MULTISPECIES: NAD(P)-dependent alcohol dehydrogenase [Gammaproteobacteria]|uniref:NADPH-dependent aldehyde reductase Ahr n=1 Tax=Gammaproteobacteria TaxID=1236 RepID=UPI001E625049|nr:MULTISPECIES: NAD(P)-dependent alcohol dehydrogenase [Gammaproteobacteria]MDP4944836.1 NAD(P)-dependent alcohol dehydrogenase [Alishewanella sp.]MCC5450136.1 NAD(P)-dependent alcohol dehydrogenase [Rheinheimera sp. UJ51]MCF4009413.1 NAD(P)-dependent alcohol dehydrogenase [Rheinheimera sp. UJ63]MDP5035514.1 NAD(P)-dependent alcohol dehydrogenase [Alishewanella sp.]MDP5186752.1 NAD(P)-dependent alcohol dehydrogenase [Alishewanella sp.]